MRPFDEYDDEDGLQLQLQEVSVEPREAMSVEDALAMLERITGGGSYLSDEEMPVEEHLEEVNGHKAMHEMREGEMGEALDSGQARRIASDLLQQRAKARMRASEYFQAQARKLHRS